MITRGLLPATQPVASALGDSTGDLELETVQRTIAAVKRGGRFRELADGAADP